eukprot:4522449-Pyramimonas_sp.AAC.1
MQKALDGLFPMSEKNRLWDRFNKTVLPKSSEATKIAWKNICALTDGTKTEQKNVVLCLQVAKPGEWETLCGKELRTFIKTRQEMEEGEWFYEGEMIQKHGEKEFGQFKAMGKFKTKEDEDGITKYQKIREIERKSKTLEDKAEVKKSANLSEEQLKQLEDSMADQFRSSRRAITQGEASRGGRGNGRGSGRGAGRGSARGSTDLVDDIEDKSKANARKMMALLDKKADSLGGVHRRLKNDKLKKSIALSAEKMISKVEGTKNKIKDKYEKEPYNHSTVNAAVASAVQ